MANTSLLLDSLLSEENYDRRIRPGFGGENFRLELELVTGQSRQPLTAVGYADHGRNHRRTQAGYGGSAPLNCTGQLLDELAPLNQGGATSMMCASTLLFCRGFPQPLEVGRSASI